MVPVVVVLILLLVLIRWRVGHGQRRSTEAEFRQLGHRPLAEFDARFPADRRQRAGVTRRRRSGMGF